MSQLGSAKSDAATPTASAGDMETACGSQLGSAKSDAATFFSRVLGDLAERVSIRQRQIRRCNPQGPPQGTQGTPRLN